MRQPFLSHSIGQEVSILGPNWQNSLRLPLSDLSSRVQLQDYQMEGEKPLNVDLAQQSSFLGPLVFLFFCSVF